MNAVFWLVDKRYDSFLLILSFFSHFPNRRCTYPWDFRIAWYLQYPVRGKISSLNSLWRRGCNSELLGSLLSTNDKVKKYGSVSRPVGNCFASATDDEICDILIGRNSKNTGKTTKFAVKLLMGYRIVQEYNIDFENRNTSDLNLLLKEFGLIATCIHLLQNYLDF
jgi:hypothetical protein